MVNGMNMVMVVVVVVIIYYHDFNFKMGGFETILRGAVLRRPVIDNSID